jgi:hypothetical protein
MNDNAIAQLAAPALRPWAVSRSAWCRMASWTSGHAGRHCQVQGKAHQLGDHLVAANLATARDIAISASNEFGVPLLDLDAVALDMDAVRSVSEKLLQKHRVLPLMKRGKRCSWRSPIRPICTRWTRFASRPR